MKRGLLELVLNNEDVGEKIRNVRKSNNMTQIGFSHRMHITQQMLSRYENGKSNIPNDIIETISKEFHVPLSYFFGIDTENISEDEWILIEYYRRVNKRLKKKALELMQVMADDIKNTRS